MTTEETISHKIMIYAEMRKPDRMNQFAVEEIIREELATLRAKSEAYDDGQEAWAVKCPSGQLAHTGTQDECSRECADLNAADMFLDGRVWARTDELVGATFCIPSWNRRGEDHLSPFVGAYFGDIRADKNERVKKTAGWHKAGEAFL